MDEESKLEVGPVIELGVIDGADRGTRHLHRPSYGSFGDEVRSLQTRLNTSDDGKFGSGTKKMLTVVEITAGSGASTGIYSRHREEILGFDIFGN